MAGIAYASSAGRECDITRLLKLVEEHRHRGGGESCENQCDDKNSHGIPQQIISSMYFMGVGVAQSKLPIVALSSQAWSGRFFEMMQCKRVRFSFPVDAGLRLRH